MQNVARKTNLGYLTQCIHWQCPCRVTRNSYHADRTKQKNLEPGEKRKLSRQCEQLPSRWPGCFDLAVFSKQPQSRKIVMIRYKDIKQLCFAQLNFAKSVNCTICIVHEDSEPSLSTHKQQHKLAEIRFLIVATGSPVDR